MNNEKKHLTARDLALFLGCVLETPNGRGYLIEVHANMGNERVTAYIQGTNYYFSPVYKVRPVLRPFSDMTDAELLAFAKICTGAKTVYSVASAISNFKNVICVFEDDAKERLVVNDCGETWYASYFGGDGDGARNTIRQHDQTRWLVSNGFDVFGWIPAGLAVDATKKEVQP